MAELYPSDAELNALSGTTDSEQEVLFVATGESPYYTSFYKMLQRLLKVCKRGGDLRVFKDGDLTFGVRAGKYYNGDSWVSYSQVTAQALTNNATNYVFLTAAGSLTVNTTGFPVPSVMPHIPLAKIVTSAGAYDGRDASEGGDITDYRGGTFISVCGSSSGSLNALDWQESLLDELDFTAAEPAAPTLGDRYLNTGTGAGSVTGQTVAANDIEEWNGTSWTEITPTEGACCLVEDRDMLIGFNSAAWVDLGTFANIKDLTDGGDASALHTHNLASGATDVTASAAELNLNDSAVAGTAVASKTAALGANKELDEFHTPALYLGAGAGTQVTATAAQLNEAGTFFNATDITGAEAEELTDGSTTTKHIHAVTGLAAAVQDLMPNLNITAGDESGDERRITVQARDAANNNLAERFLIRVWISTADYGAPAVADAFSVATGTTYETDLADAAYLIISDANGKIEVDIGMTGAATRYIMAEVDGRIYSSGAVEWAA